MPDASWAISSPEVSPNLICTHPAINDPRPSGAEPLWRNLDHGSALHFLISAQSSLWKATIATRFRSVDLEVRGASPGELTQWL